MSEFFTIVRESQVCTPSMELLLLLTVLTLCLVFRTIKTGLLAAYLFAFHWGWIFMDETFKNTHPIYTYSFLAFGCLAIVISVISFLFPGATD